MSGNHGHIQNQRETPVEVDVKNDPETLQSNRSENSFTDRPSVRYEDLEEQKMLDFFKYRNMKNGPQLAVFFKFLLAPYIIIFRDTSNSRMYHSVYEYKMILARKQKPRQKKLKSESWSGRGGFILCYVCQGQPIFDFILKKKNILCSLHTHTHISYNSIPQWTV